VSVPEAICYPRPLQARVPLLVGGSGERRTLALVARHADACNLGGDASVVARKLDVLRHHCLTEGRRFEDIEVTHLSTALVGADRAHLSGLVEQLRPRRRSPEQFAAQVGAGTVQDQIGRYRSLADAGVQLAVVSLADLGDIEALTRFEPVIEAFAPAGVR
jgi:alkanesulfonate monooxygenase SsuD/methylene tetrahydromethanopterin reductase-like flavin-dependent oxidoreductase (luciferase family)